MLNSQNTLEIETNGNVSDVTSNTHQEWRVYKIAISGDAAERTLVLTQIIAMPSVSFVTTSGKVMDEKSILRLKKRSLGKRDIINSKLEHSNTKKEMIN